MDRSEFRRGVKDVVPLLLGIVPFGFIAGIATVNAGLGLPEAVGLSTIVFAGAAQLAALDLIGRDAPLAIVVVTAVVINLRMLMYSASIAPHFQTLSRRTKATVAYLLTDQAYALSIARYRGEGASRSVAYYLGVAVTLWVVWQLTTVAGVVLGTSVPESLGLEFAVPLVFLALLIPAMEDGPTTIAGIFGGIVAAGAAGWPLNLGLLVGATVGVLAGLLAETRMGGGPRVATSYAGPVVWGLIVVIGVLTFLIRLSFIALFGYLDEIPPRIEHGLRFVPAAVLAALVLPSFVTLEPGAGGIAVDKLAAGVVAGAVAWRTENVLVTIGAGMATLWVVRFALLPAL